MKIKYIAITKEWSDKINGNSYFSVSIEDIDKDIVYRLPFQYGYGSQSEYVIKDFLKLKGFNSDLPIRFIKIDNCKKKDVIKHGEGNLYNPMTYNIEGSKVQTFYYCD